jgi:hypothetical protein
VTNSRLPAGKVVKVYNGRGDVENRIKEGKNTLRWDKTSCHRYAANEARLLVGVTGLQPLAHASAILPLGEEVKRSMEWLIKRLIKVGVKVAYHGRKWQVHVASAFPLARYGLASFGSRGTPHRAHLGVSGGSLCPKGPKNSQNGKTAA